MMEKFGRQITEQDWFEYRRKTHDDINKVKRLLNASNDNDIFLGYQKRLLASTNKHEVTLCSKSRRTGATWAIASDAILHAASSSQARGMDVFYMGYNLDMAREFIEVCAAWARAFDHAASQIDEFIFEANKDPDKSIKAFRIRFASGFEIIALPSRPRSLRSKQGYVIIDEAAFHDDLAGVITAAMALLIWGGKVCIISTHNGEMNHFNELVNDTRTGRKDYHLVEFDFDDALKDGLYKRICAVNGNKYSFALEAAWRAKILGIHGEDADQELFCIPSMGNGVYFPRQLIAKQQRDDIPVLRWVPPSDDFTEWAKSRREAYLKDWIEENVDPLLKKLNPDLRHAFGQDYAYAVDLSVLWVLAVERNTVRTTPFVIEMRRMPFEQQKQLLFYIAARLPRLSGGKIDANGNGHALAQVTMQRFGARLIEEVHISREWYRAHMPPYKAAFEDGNIIIPKDDDILTDHRLVRLSDGVAQIPRVRVTSKSDGKKRHGDSAVAGVLAYAASDTAPLVYDGYQSAYAPNDHDNSFDDYDDGTIEDNSYYTRNDGLN